jgi:RNA polymerase sigma-70 factor (ECF subfamily)
MGDETTAARARFEALYAAEGRRVLAYALRRTAQPADAADVLAEVFLVAWRRLDDVPRGAEARLWLYGVARGVLANHRRSLRRRDRLGQRLAGVLTEHAGADPAELTGLGGGEDVVRAALALLPPNDREVIQLTIWEELGAPEVAAVLGVPAATVRTRLHRARRRLRGLLAGAGPAAAAATVAAAGCRPDRGPRPRAAGEAGSPRRPRSGVRADGETGVDAGPDRRAAPGGDEQPAVEARAIGSERRGEQPARVGHVRADGRPPVRDHEDPR